MATTIATAQELATFLKITDNNGAIIVPASNTDPTLDYLELIINGVVEDFNNKTGHSYGALKQVTEIHNLEAEYEAGHGVPVHLEHRQMATFSTGSNDKIELWDGTSWEDISASNDFHFIESMGKLYLHGYLSWNTQNRVRITYRFGVATASADIKLAVLKESAAIVIEGSMAMNNIAFGVDRGLRSAELVSKWHQDFKDCISEHAEVVRVEY